MTYEINETHDPNLKSWVESANDPNTDFPIQNLPFCSYVPRIEPMSAQVRVGIVIGDWVFDIASAFEEGKLFEGKTLGWQVAMSTFDHGQLSDELMADSASDLQDFRRRMIELLQENADGALRKKVAKYLTSIKDVIFTLPSSIGDYTDFYCSIYHATNVGSMFRPDNPLLPNYKYVPIGYHGRASSIVISGTDIKRPHGQNRSDAERPPVFIPSKSLDYEMELGFFVGKGNEMGSPININDAEQHIFGVCLVNDWSARDIQAWEYQPLGPFLAKNFATTISPYVVTMEALAPFRTKAFERDADDPQPLDYLNGEQNQKLGGLDINLEVYIQTEKMRAENIEPHMLSRSNTKDLYWTIGQMLTHHASNGCNLQTGDLMATGTVSGPEKSERGCLLELTWRGTEPIDLPSGEQRRFLEDGDEIIMKGYCEREGFRRIGLGECRGRIIPAD
ncbi:MAG TPA: fumarylacetoacetase [Pyrinomonadaceae bacterium]|nr:fumarylacetoacetase [Pyrinomonadaceae bacterium]